MTQGVGKAAEAWATLLHRRGYERVPDNATLHTLVNDTVSLGDIYLANFRELVSHKLQQLWVSSRTGT